MSRRDYIRTSIAIAATNYFPKSVRDTIIAEADFRSNFHVTADAVVNFNKMGVGFQRSALFAAIKMSFGNGEVVNVDDIDGHAWTVKIIDDKEPTTVEIFQGDKRSSITHLALLSPGKEARTKVFRLRAGEVNLPEESRRSWEAVLDMRTPDDDEIGLIQDDFNDTPVSAINAIRDNLASGTISLDVLVPRSTRYYERLVGKCEDGAKPEDYIREVAGPHMRSSIEWKPFEGFQLSLLLGSQPAFSLALGEILKEERLLSEIFEWAANKGDAISRASCIEMGLHKISDCPSIKESLSRVIDSFVMDATVAQVDQFHLLSALFSAVYGEMSLRKMLSSKPPFWRRLAALAQAGMIARQFIINGRDASDVTNWLSSVPTLTFTLQCQVDMRLEPWWFAELAVAKQMRNELLGRVWLAAKANETGVTSIGWMHRLLEEGAGTLLSQFELSEAFLPGPLEGGSTPKQELSEDLIDSIKEDLSKPLITAASFAELANVAFFCRIPPELVNLASTAIVRADYRLETSDVKFPIQGILVGLASVAAIARNHALADALYIVLRKYRKFYPKELSIDVAFRVAVVAAASREELIAWTKCIGGCMNDLAFQEITREEAIHLHMYITHLCSLVPELWATCGQAEAALQAVLSS